jgi:threonine dehydrogenase-like Zn-dependent dehydrogenase
MLAWQLYAAGLENLGENGRPVPIPVPVPAEDEILVRVDAVGLCFSDAKLIRAGSDHPRIAGRDLKANPTIPGHEVSVTVVKVGGNRARDFRVGQRYIVQADVLYKGENPAFGYAIPGGFAQYALIDKRMLDGDEGCYLLPVEKDLGYAEAALIEPWACVEAAYVMADRRGTKPQGKLLLVIWNGADTLRVLAEIEELLRSDARPSSLFISDQNLERQQKLIETVSAVGVEVRTLARPTELIGNTESKLGESTRFDDIVLIRPPSCEAVDMFISMLDKDGIANVIGDGLRGAITVDVGAVHYRGVRVVGSDHGSLFEQYTANLRTDLKPDGAAWFVGAGGPMGQMHVQRAVASKNPPRIIAATDVDDARLHYLQSRFEQTAQQNGISFHAFNPRNFDEQSAFERKLLELTASAGFDDVVLMAPVVAAIEQAARFVAPGGILNVFAGVGIGTNVQVNVDLVFKSCRIVGSSGSRIRDLERTLELTEQGLIFPNESVAAIGGMRALRDGIEAVQNGVFSGKVVIYPHVVNLPLTPLDELEKTMPSVASRLADRGLWTREAERALLERELAK